MQWSELRMAGRLRAVVAISVLLLSACATLPRNPVPAQYTPMATIPGMPDVRGWAGVPSVDLDQDFHLSMRQESSEDFPVGSDGMIVYPYLALSGGGSNGAFGAGFLNGWTASGRRPVFKIVTGVSTGALMAPFVFIGTEGDKTLEHFYTTTSNDDVFTAGSVLMALLRRESMADTRPLAELIAQVADRELLRKVAAEHGRGREARGQGVRETREQQGAEPGFGREGFQQSLGRLCGLGIAEKGADMLQRHEEPGRQEQAQKRGQQPEKKAGRGQMVQAGPGGPADQEQTVTHSRHQHKEDQPHPKGGLEQHRHMAAQQQVSGDDDKNAGQEPHHADKAGQLQGALVVKGFVGLKIKNFGQGAEQRPAQSRRKLGQSNGDERRGPKIRAEVAGYMGNDRIHAQTDSFSMRHA